MNTPSPSQSYERQRTPVTSVTEILTVGSVYLGLASIIW